LQGSTNYLKPSEALKLLEKEGCDQRLISHLKAVSALAKTLASDIKAAGHKIDVGFVESAALLHDIGRSRTHGIRHGVEGAAIMRALGYEAVARVCETHIGAGIAKEEAEELGLPKRDYLPETLEEKVVAHADNLVDGERVVPIEDSLAHLAGKLGADHPAVKRVRELSDFIASLMK
jgi:uncharacterized protein